MVSAIRRHIFKVLYGFLLTAFTIYVLLDAFVIPGPICRRKTESITPLQIWKILYPAAVPLIQFQIQISFPILR